VRFTETAIAGVQLIDIEPHADERGWFGRIYCQDEFEAHGISGTLCQGSISFNPRQGTLRGMHYQAEPYPESKLVRCTSGRIFDVVVDLRPASATFRRWIAEELSAETRRSLFIPPGCAHGFLTLTDNAEVVYLMTDRHQPAASRGVRWNDPAFGIEWPASPVIISDRDARYPDFDAPGERAR
jgi:dTDP-4-dehydrorhamnose 3,5-epimerase